MWNKASLFPLISATLATLWVLSFSSLQGAGACRPDTLIRYILDTLPEYDSCHQARPICGDSTLNYIIYSDPTIPDFFHECCPAQTYPDCCVDYGCLNFMALAPENVNPHWFFTKIDQPGKIVFAAHNQPNPYIYWMTNMIIYGPFTAPTNACVNQLTSENIVDCFYSFAQGGIARCTINYALPGEFYLIRISGIFGIPPTYTETLVFYQENVNQPGAGSTTCDFMVNCGITTITHEVSPCNPANGTFSVNGQIYFSNPPSTGYLVVWDSLTGFATTIPPPFNSPESFILDGIPCDNLIHPIYASFWDSAGCESRIYIQAPVICPDATMSGGGNICDDGNSIAAISIQITPGASPPITLAWRINGEVQPPITSSGPFPYVFNTTQAGIYTLDTSYNAFCPGQLNGEAVVNLLPLPQPNLGEDITTCEGNTVILDPGAGYTTYLWNTGDTTPTIEVDKADTYWVEVTDINGCSNTDTIQIIHMPKPSPKNILHR
ncbi:MAG: hypothetical protein GX459_02540 [Bacteroidales bacterium]|nr:hypothetical protein [Bacteroidales bacterium]